jgi:hypothetical protein
LNAALLLDHTFICRQQVFDLAHNQTPYVTTRCEFGYKEFAT